MRDVHCNAHVREVESVAQPDQGQSDDMMRNQLLEVLTRLLQHQHQHNRLLRPITRLQQVIRLEHALMRAVRESLVHASRVEIPHRAATHDPHAERTVEPKVQRRVRLLHKAALLGSTFDPACDGDGADEALHAELARETEHDDVEGDEGEVAPAFAVVSWRVGVCADGGGDQGVRGIERVREEEACGERVRGRRVDKVESQADKHEDQGQEPCVSDACAFELGEGTADAAAFGAAGLV